MFIQILKIKYAAKCIRLIHVDFRRKIPEIASEVAPFSKLFASLKKVKINVARYATKL
jgi:hypothetical protein